jgi:hypothetical protein
MILLARPRANGLSVMSGWSHEKLIYQPLSSPQRERGPSEAKSTSSGTNQPLYLTAGSKVLNSIFNWKTRVACALHCSQGKEVVNY